MADLNRMAFRVVQHATEPHEEPTPAQVNGRNGGKKGGRARAMALSAAERSAIAKKAAATRWQSKSEQSSGSQAKPASESV